MKRRRYLAPWGRAAAAARAVEAGAGPPDAEALAALEGKPALYHCVSRVVDRGFRLGPAEKEEMVRRMRVLEAFCQVRVLTFCIMGNHFHVLVEVPERPAEDPTDAQLLEHLGILYGGQRLAGIRWELEQYRGQGNHAAAEALRQRFLRRMWDLSVFVGEWKNGFSRWYNRRARRKGYLWEERFKSVLVEEGHAARVVAGYIDLNPVRAGMVGEAWEYRWSGWGEAAAGGGKAREGIAAVMLERELARSAPEVAVGGAADVDKALEEYGALLRGDLAGGRARAAGEGAGGKARAAGGRPGRGGGGPARGGGGLAERELLGRRVRYFVDGLVIGSRGFVDGVFALSRGWFGAGRRSGARPLARAETALRSMRGLKLRLYGPGDPGRDGA